MITDAIIATGALLVNVFTGWLPEVTLPDSWNFITEYILPAYAGLEAIPILGTIMSITTFIIVFESSLWLLKMLISLLNFVGVAKSDPLPRQ